MCGIAGKLSVSIPVGQDVLSVQAMTDAQSHRGPDSSGVNILHTADPSVVFGHRRLAILDLSPAGHQPMQDPDTGCWITFNGEIYNFQALRRGLEQRGIRFHSRTDTEVILKLYALDGTQAIS